MFCNKCGYEIADNSKFCNNCGEQIQKNRETETSNIENDDAKYKEDKFETKVIIGLITIFVLISALSVIFAIVSTKKVNDNNNDNFIGKIFLKKATADDITIDFYSIPSLISSEKYYTVLQANERIDDLIIEIDFLDNNNKILKTEKIKVGKVTPGNEYKYELNQNGLDFNQIDKTKSFKTRIIKGYILE